MLEWRGAFEGVEGERRPLEQVVRRHLAQQLREIALLHRAVGGGQDVEAHLLVEAERKDLAHPRGRQAGNRQHHVAGPQLLDEPRQIVDPAEDRPAADDVAPFRRVVVDEADHVPVVVRVALQVAQQHLAGLAGADDQGAHRAAAAAARA